MKKNFNIRKWPTVLGGVLFGLLLFLSGPAKVSALSTLCGELSPGGSVNCGSTTIYQVIGGVLTNIAYAEIGVSIISLADGDTLPGVTDVAPGTTDSINPGGDYVYQYQIQDVFAEAVSDVNFNFLFAPSNAVIQSGYIAGPGADPTFPSLNPDPLLPGIDPLSGNFFVTYNPTLLPNPGPSDPVLPADILYVRSYVIPGLNTISMTGDFNTSTIGAAAVMGPGEGEIAGVVPTPEPSTLILLGSGLLALALGYRKI